MPQKTDPRKKHLLLSEERYEALQPEKLLRKLGVRAGDTVADIGCGPGFFTLPAAAIAGQRGMVLAADIQGEMLTTVRSRAAEQGLTNVRVLKTSESEIPLPEGSCDFVLLAFVLDEVDQRSTFLHRAARAMKSTGKLAVLEWDRVESEGPPLEDRISREELVEDAHAAGLHVRDSGDLGESQYYYVFARVAK
ncbi:MAG TPA: class I SAM-dependent methyltransferase [Ktedonobacterales bacterium]|jgi:ubiquinone/menaquinone biosynthesis C-methylase UbiE|nr:class I SAM-dependent methyltransferase [Ktedonobacterales bacterium]